MCYNEQCEGFCMCCDNWMEDERVSEIKYLTHKEKAELKTIFSDVHRDLHNQYLATKPDVNSGGDVHLFGVKHSVFSTLKYITNQVDCTLGMILDWIKEQQSHVGTRVLSDHPDDVCDHERLQGMMEGYRITASYLRGYSQY